MKKTLLLILLGFSISGIEAQNIDGIPMFPLASTTLPKNITDSNGNNLAFTFSLYNPYLKCNHAVVVVVPPQWYTESTKVFPVMYHAHGTTLGMTGAGVVGTSDPLSKGLGHISLEMIQAGVIEPYIVVFPSTGPNSAIGPVEKWYLEIMMPYIEKNFRASNRAEMRCISGHSMGGGVSMALGMRYNDKFFTQMPVGAAASPIPDDGTYPLPGGTWYNQWLYNMEPFIDEMLWDKDDFLSVFEGIGSNIGKRRYKYLIGSILNASWDTTTANCGHDDICTWDNQKVFIHQFMESRIVKVLQTKTNNDNIVSEDGRNDSITLELERKPTSDVTITLNPELGINVSPSQVIFTTLNWNTPKVISISAINNGIADGERMTSIKYTVSSTDIKFNNCRVFRTAVKICDDESRTIVNFVSHKPSTNPPALLYSGRYTVSEHAELSDKKHDWDDTLCWPKNENIILSVGLTNPDPSSSTSVTVKLVTQKLGQTAAWTPAFANSDDLRGFKNSILVFAPGEVYKELVIKPTIDEIQEGTEVAQFALTCVSGGYNAMKGSMDIANIGLQDHQLDRAKVAAKTIISEVNHGINTNDFAVELYNLNYRDAGLTGYNLRILKNGTTDWATAIRINNLNVPHGPSLRNNDVLVLCSKTTTDPVLKATCHVAYAELNGTDENDVIGLFNGETLLDVVGVPGEEPIGGWNVSGVIGATSKVMIRKPEIFSYNNNFSAQVNSTFNTSEWIIEEKGFTGYIGYHVVQSGSYALLNDTSKHDSCDVTTEIEMNLTSEKKSEIFAFPNPTKNTVTIQSHNKLIKGCKVLSIDGVLHKELNCLNSQTVIDISNLINGIYLIEVLTNNGKEIIKVIKE